MILQAEVACRAATALADDTQAVRVIDHDPCTVFLGKGADFGQLGNVAAHGEYAVGDDQCTAVFGYLLQSAFEACHVGMTIAEHFAVAELAAVVDGGVVFTGADDVIIFGNESGDDAKI